MSILQLQLTFCKTCNDIITATTDNWDLIEDDFDTATEANDDIFTAAADTDEISTAAPIVDDVSTTDVEYTFDENYEYDFNPENYENDDFGDDYENIDDFFGIGESLTNNNSVANNV